MPMAKIRDYEVGYGKPPKATQFKTGQSGNSKGRSRGSLNAVTLMQQVVSERVTVVEKGQEKSMSMLEVLLRRMVNKAAAGDLKAIPMVLTLVEQGLSENEEGTPQSEKDQLLLHSALLKMRQGLLSGDANAKESG